MNVQIKPMPQLNKTATQALIKEMGVVDTLRFLSQFQVDTGDYTKERQQLFQGVSAKDILQDIKRQEAQAN